MFLQVSFYPLDKFEWKILQFLLNEINIKAVKIKDRNNDFHFFGRGKYTPTIALQQHPYYTPSIALQQRPYYTPTIDLQQHPYYTPTTVKNFLCEFLIQK